MPITGLDQVARIPGQAEAAAKEHHAGIRVAESTRGLYTQHRAGRRVTAITLPAVGKTAWISVLDPHAGTSRGGNRTRFTTREQALDHSREHTLEVADKLADKLLEHEWHRAEAEVIRLLEAL